MDRMKTFLIYALLVVGFAILSEVLINVALNSTYKDIDKRNELPAQINVYQAEASLIDGRIRGFITNSEAEDINGKYIKIDFYSERDVYLGKKYIFIENSTKETPKNFELLFKLENVKSYEISIVDEKEEGSLEIETLIKELTKPERIVGAAIAILLFK